MSSVSVNESLPAPGLREDAGYGWLAFDHYVMERWDSAKPKEEDQQQWDEIARSWLAMDSEDRNRYVETAMDLQTNPNAQKPNQEQILRMFAPHQTVQERNASVNGADFGWVRTFYGHATAAAYAEMTENYLADVGEKSLVFDNESLYRNLGDDLSGLFTRAPQLCAWYADPYDDLAEEEPPEDETMLPLFLAAKREKGMMFVLDAESQEKRMLKICWFGSNGELLWWNWLKLSDLLDWHGRAIGRGDRLFWIYDMSEDDTDLRSKGALIRVNP
ncbi:hypothetical protein BS50DRAFT_578473 [Corynespora cassiicola Philippines]|uniref:Uncharacterized protein n=1 Tax=Corynespora cassiicola Philippines TaxID=1448308 RepID=A0A2T2N7S9_CORCC|nr:hypothetical protein BS50DRAFT_578473 [Corynespora cassiicola Philippines]